MRKNGNIIISFIKCCCKNKFTLCFFREENTVLELNERKKREIEEKVEEIRRKYGLPAVDFDLIKFLRTCENFEIQLRIINDDTTGLLFVDDNNLIQNSNSNRLIVVNQKLIDDDEFIQKRRFICAHEYGHFILHKMNASTFARRDTRIKDNEEELEAEYFAYCLLMPEKQIFHLFKSKRHEVEKIRAEQNMTYPEIVANIFNVSIKKAAQRINDLGVLYEG